MIPLYLDHLFFPTLTASIKDYVKSKVKSKVSVYNSKTQEESFVTEVHHVNGLGEDAGVVYAEMQSRENTQQDLLWNETFKHMYPGNSGYAANVGGATKSIRTSTNLEKVMKSVLLLYLLSIIRNFFFADKRVP